MVQSVVKRILPATASSRKQLQMIFTAVMILTEMVKMSTNGAVQFGAVLFPWNWCRGGHILLE